MKINLTSCQTCIALALLALVTTFLIRQVGSLSQSPPSAVVSAAVDAGQLKTSRLEHSAYSQVLENITCEACGENHHAAHPHIKKLIEVNPEVKRWMSRDPKNVTQTTLKNGTKVFSFNGTFGHMSAALIKADGSVTTTCTTSAEEIAQFSHPQETAIK